MSHATRPLRPAAWLLALGSCMGPAGAPTEIERLDGSSDSSKPAAPKDAGAADQRRADATAAGADPDAAPDKPPAIDPANDELYDPERLPRFELEVPPESIAALRAHEGTPLEREYVRATFRYGAETVTNIGLRIKGESNRTAFEVKPAWKIKFDEFVVGQSFRGLRRMTLNNLGEDPSGIAERLAYHFFRAAKLPAPRANNALVHVNGEPYGVYANVETEDKTFLRRWFADDNGNLYEEGQKDFLPGNEGTFELETNEKQNDRTDLRDLIAALAKARDGSYLDDLDQQLDTTHFLRFTAAEGVVNQWDMYGYSRFYPNNFRLYHDPAAAKFVFLPWGMDMAWKPYHDGDPHLRMLDLAHDNNDPRMKITAGAMFVRCLSLPACKAKYVAVVKEVLDLFERSGLDALAERYHAQIKPHVLADKHKEITNQIFERSHATVLRTIRERAAKIRAELPR